MSAVALVLVGDELLSGKFSDENGPLVIRSLRERGARLVRLAVVQDRVEEIAAEVRLALGVADWVLTSGGIGPTHDDLTYEGVAAGLGVPLEQRPELVAILDRYEIAKTTATLRMARIPAGSELLASPGSPLPVVRAGRVIVLPGVPKLFREALGAALALVRGEPLFTARVTTALREVDFADRLSALVAAHPLVQVGSYPRPDGVTIVTLESCDEAALSGMSAEVSALLQGR
ncbi:MAG: competence/damage-inducible protein A [Deltaproteobacteria bacterium]|nr:competence/damage-inducible protein A [Deltaproteobacteria bacterium]